MIRFDYFVTRNQNLEYFDFSMGCVRNGLMLGSGYENDAIICDFCL